MDIIYKVLVTVLGIIVFFSVGFATTLSSASEVETNNYFETVSEVIVASDYNEEVIDSLIDEAAENGHVLSVEIYQADTLGAKKTADVRLEYVYRVGLFGIEINKIKQKVL